MKTKASQELFKEVTEEVAEEGENRQFASSVTVIDPDGDLQMDFVRFNDDSLVPTSDSLVPTDANLVAVKDDVVRSEENGGLRGLLVNKTCLRLSSPVFRTMLAEDSPFHESMSKTTNRDGIQVVRFHDDDMATMEVLMNAIHLRNYKVPIYVTIARFEELAIACDKYDIRCLGPWAQIWAKHHLQQDCSSAPKSLFIASVFTLADWFVRLTKDLILKTTLSSEGELLFEHSSNFREGVPQSILDRIAERRTNVIVQLLECCWQQKCKLRYGNPVCQMHLKPPHERHSCDGINLRSVIRGFPELLGSQLDEDDPHPTSAVEILSSISNLTHESDISPLNNRITLDHKACHVGPILTFWAKEIIDSVEGIELEPVSFRAPPEQPTPPSSLSVILEQMHHRLGSVQFKAEMRLTAVPNNTTFWEDIAVRDQAISDSRFAWCPKVTCVHCPEFEYSLFQHPPNDDIVKALNLHIVNSVHMGRYRRFAIENCRRHIATLELF